MKSFCAALTVLCFSSAHAAADNSGGVHRYIIERTFPAGALAGLDSTVKETVNANNAKFGVTWEMSYTNKDKTKTYCVYDAPSEEAVREAAKANALPVDSVMEVPLTLMPKGTDARFSK